MFTYVLFFILGVLFWTFLEYCIHRFLGHQNKATHIVRIEHKRHHAERDYFAPWYKKLLFALVFLCFSTLFWCLFFSIGYALSFSVGLALMYIVYEATHKFFHIKEPKIKYGLKMRKHHFYHHFGNPKLNHGVTTSFWDKIFGTFQPTENIQVPKNMAMRWLFDERNNFKNKYKQHFILR